MAITAATRFGARANAAKNQASEAKEVKKSQFWLNVGYTTEVDTDDNGTDTKFVSLPVGLALDSLDKVKTNSSNKDFAAFQSARNDLLDQLLALAGELQPGEDRIVNLQVQVRRVNAEAAPIESKANKFGMNFNL